ncbi:MAG: hypothetical protein GC134_04650 [Proteobacteria bacterium]|nr:hypothetical protein [Pseudomonadota bacterium]
MTRTPRPWDDTDFDTDNDDEMLWAEEIEAEEFLFAVTEQDGETVVTFCPESYWKGNGHLYDSYMALENILPANYGEMTEDSYSEMTGLSRDDIIAELEELGFTHSQKLEDFVS